MNPSSPQPGKANVVQLSRPHYAPLEYKLRLALKSVSATIVRAYSIKTQQQKDDWMQNVVGNRALIETWIDVSQLTGENNIQRVVERGIQVPEYGVKISCGNITLQDSDDKLGSPAPQQSGDLPRKPKKVFKLIHVWACIGRPFVTEAKEGELVIPHGYDSVYLQPVEPAQEPQDMLLPQGAQQYEGIYGNQQKQPQTPSRSAPPAGGSSLNNSSGLNPPQQQPPLPQQQEDDDFHHKFIVYDSNKLFADYLVYLEYSPDSDEVLKESIPLNQGFDLNDGRRMSMQSVRSTGTLIDGGSFNNSIVQQAYQSILQNLEQKQSEIQDDPFPVLMENDEHRERVDTLKEQMEELEQRRDQICQNAMEVENELREQFKKSLLELHDITQLKLSKLCSTEVDLARRIQEMQWMNQFIDYQKEILDPLSFVESYSHHANIKDQKMQQMEASQDQAEEIIDTVIPDIHCAGQMRVESNTECITDQMRKHRQVVLLNPPNEKNRLSNSMKEGQNSGGNAAAGGPLDEDALKRGECVVS